MSRQFHLAPHPLSPPVFTFYLVAVNSGLELGEADVYHHLCSRKGLTLGIRFSFEKKKK